MTLDTWRTENRLTWANVSRQLELTRNGSLQPWRLEQLRQGKATPTIAERKALGELTKSEVDDFRE